MEPDRRLGSAAAAVALVLLAACSSGGQPADSPTPPTPAATAGTPTAATATPPTPADTGPPATPAPTPPAATAGPLVAGPEGLGAVQLGQPAADAIAALRARRGPADADSGWQRADNSPFGVCPGATAGARVRGLRWGRVRLLVSDADTRFGAAGDPHVFAYHVTSFEGSGPGPRTAAGIGLGASVRELRDAYPGRVTIRPADEINPDRFAVDFGGRGELTGSLTGTGPQETVTFLSAGQACGE